MNHDLREQPLPSLLHPFERRSERRLRRRSQEHDQMFCLRVQDIFVGRGLTQTNYGPSGYNVRVPAVIEIIVGPPVGLKVRTLPGQTPDDFAAHAPAIAQNLGAAEVRVVPLGPPSLIRLDLLPETRGDQVELVTQQSRTTWLPSPRRPSERSGAAA